MKLIIKNPVIHKKILKKKKYTSKNINCEICKRNKSKVFQNIGKTGNKPGLYGYLPISICYYCGHKYLSPRYPDIFYKEFFKKEYGKSLFKKTDPTKRYLKFQKERGERVYSFLNKFLKKKSNSKLLDHGTATGLALVPWLKNNWNCYGIDPHKPSVKYAKNQGLNVRYGFGEKLPFKANYFDLIISLGSFEHAYDINKTFKEFYRTLKKNGILFLRWRSDKLSGSPLEYYNYVTNRYFTKNSLTNLMLKHNFHISKFINNKIEGYDTFEYIIAKKKNKNFKIKLKSDAKKVLNYHYKYYKKYYFTCLKASSLKKTNLKTRLTFIKKNNIGLMNIGKVAAINRVFNEMNYYLKTLKKHNINK